MPKIKFSIQGDRTTGKRKIWRNLTGRGSRVLLFTSFPFLARAQTSNCLMKKLGLYLGKYGKIELSFLFIMLNEVISYLYLKFCFV